MITLLAILTVACQGFVAAVAIVSISNLLGRPGPLRALRGLIARDAPKLAALVALVAMAGSLYMSEVKHFPPCQLCWYQRIGMYPLALILSIAARVDDRRIARYVIPLAAAGAAVSIYHVQLERFPEQETIACSSSVPCTTVWFEQFGYITIPTMALTAFLTVIALVWLGRATHGKGISTESE